MATAPAVTVLICTRDRAGYLEEAIASLAATGTAPSWELIIIDNGSSDRTATVVSDAARTFPVSLRYCFEPRPGKSFALNTGLNEAAGRVVLFGDDDQRFAPDWVEEGCRPLLDDPAFQYTGGPVLPILQAAQPSWLDLAHAELRGPLGLFDYGDDPFIFEERHRIPGGGNMAIRASLAVQIGGFREDLGRRGRSLLGQEQAEFFARSRASGARGLYVPRMVVWHQVPPERLRRRYFLRWWYWKGIAHARWQALAARGIPRFVYSESVRAAAAALRTQVPRQPAAGRFLPLLRLAYLAGNAIEAQRGTTAPGTAPAVTPLRSQGEI